MHLRQHTSLDAPVGKGKLASKNDGDSTALLDLIKTEANDTPDDLLFTSTLKDDVKTLLANILPERHATVITKRFGLDGGQLRLSIVRSSVIIFVQKIDLKLTYAVRE